jgi:hypothetical protein
VLFRVADEQRERPLGRSLVKVRNLGEKSVGEAHKAFGLLSDQAFERARHPHASDRV